MKPVSTAIVCRGGGALYIWKSWLNYPPNAYFSYVFVKIGFICSNDLENIAIKNTS